MRTIRVILADDHSILREGLRALLENEPDLEVVAEAGDGRSALRMARELKPDVVVMDIGMPDLNGVEATRQLMEDGSDTRVLCLSVQKETAMVHAMLEAGASGYLLKTGAGRELVEAVRAVAAGDAYLSPSVASQVLDHHIKGKTEGSSGAYGVLTPREREVLQLIAEGCHTKRAAERLGISPKTVLAHRDSIRKKLGINSVSGLVRYALREGITEL